MPDSEKGISRRPGVSAISKTDSSIISRGLPRASDRAVARLDRFACWTAIAFTLVLPLGTTPADAALVIGLFAWMAHKAVRSQWRFVQTPLGWLLAAWLGSVLFSMSNTIDPITSLHGVRKFLKCAALYYWIVETVSSVSKLRGVIAASMVSMTCVVLDGLWQRLTGWDLLRHRPLMTALPFMDSPEGFQRVTATFPHPNDLAIYLISVLPLVVVLGVFGPKRWRAPAFVSALMSIVVMVLAFSRAGVLALGGALLTLGLSLRRRAPWMLLAILGALAVVATPEPARSWVRSQASWVDVLTEPERQMYWRTASNMIQAHPVFGIGTNTFSKAYPSYREAGDRFAEAGPYAHNQYLHLAAEQGLVGLAVFLLFVVRVFRMSHGVQTLVSRESLVSMTNLGLRAALVGYLILGCLESSLFYARGSLVFWWIVSLMSALWRLTRPAGPGLLTR